MKERSILLKDWEVRAFLAGRKSQIRRPVKPQPPEEFVGVTNENHRDGKIDTSGWQWFSWAATGWPGPPHNAKWLKSPFGQPGDRLWCRETWRRIWRNGTIRYKADGEHLSDVGQWEPSVRMPKSASRLTLEVVAVRVERVQRITCNDLETMGIIPVDYDDEPTGDAVAFMLSWMRDYPKYPWDSNPWVWVGEVRRIQ